MFINRAERMAEDDIGCLIAVDHDAAVRFVIGDIKKGPAQSCAQSRLSD